MKQLLLILTCVLMLVGLKVFGQPVQVIDPDFFEIDDSVPGDTVCKSVTASTKKGESGAVQRAAKMCDGPAQIQWVPRSYGPTYFQDLPVGGYSTPYANQIKGSYLVCCKKRAVQSDTRRRPGPR